MSWRIVVISSPCKLDYKMNYLVVRTVEDCQRIALDEIAILVIETTAASLTAYLLSELVSRGIRVVFCDHKHQPQSEIQSTQLTFDATKKLLLQIHWPDNLKNRAWQLIVQEKLRKQALLLNSLGILDCSNRLIEYSNAVEPGDQTNREAVAARLYFPNVFDSNFVRTEDSVSNAVLNYGYAILLSAVNREISIAGYIGNLGVFHHGGQNPFNLGCDLLEPLRPLVDGLVVSLKATEVNSIIKKQLCELLFKEVYIVKQRHTLLNAIRIYCQSFFNFMNHESGSTSINFIDYEF